MFGAMTLFRDISRALFFRSDFLFARFGGAFFKVPVLRTSGLFSRDLSKLCASKIGILIDPLRLFLLMTSDDKRFPCELYTLLEVNAFELIRCPKLELAAESALDTTPSDFLVDFLAAIKLFRPPLFIVSEFLD